MTISRSFFIFLSQNKTLTRGAKKWGIHLGASKVVAGEDIDEALMTIQSMNDQGLMATIDHLGEFITEKSEVEEAKQKTIEIIESVCAKNVQSELTVKLTKLGLDIDTDYCIENMKEILQAAKDKQNFVNIDMEDYSRYEKTLSVLKTLRKEYDNVGTVLQGYLRRGLDDLDSLAGVPLRIVKGAYQEKEEVAFKDKHEIDANYFLMIQKHLQQEGFTAIGTHDHRIINAVKLFVKDQGIAYDTFEFQMLYGFRTELQLQLVQEGYNVRVYVPFGKEWYGYFMRRLAERPQNLVSVAKGIITK